MERIRGQRGTRHAWVASRLRSVAAGSPHLASSREGWPPSVSCEAQEGGGGGEGVKVKGFQAAARPWAAASAGCFDHAGAVAVSFCSRGSSRAAGRPPWGPALPRLPPAARTREGGRGAWPGRLQAPPDAPSSLPVAPQAAASCWGGGAGRPQLPRRRGAWGLGPVPGRPGNGGAPAAALRSPPRLAPRLAHSPHACTLLAGGDAALRLTGAQSDGHALPRPGRAPAAATPEHTRGTRARTAHTRTVPTHAA